VTRRRAFRGGSLLRHVRLQFLVFSSLTTLAQTHPTLPDFVSIWTQSGPDFEGVRLRIVTRSLFLTVAFAGFAAMDGPERSPADGTVITPPGPWDFFWTTGAAGFSAGGAGCSVAVVGFW
jgi:hypothetical protein